MKLFHAEELIDDYLTRLKDETRDLPRDVQHELISSIEEHVTEARATLVDETDADVLNILERLGDPADLAREARGRVESPTAERVKFGLFEIGAILFLPFFWPIGVLLLWCSGAWRWKDKLLASLLPPGGYLFILVGFSTVRTACGSGQTLRNGHLQTFNTCSSSAPGWQSVLGVAAVIVLFALPILTSIYLAVRLRRRIAKQGMATVFPA